MCGIFGYIGKLDRGTAERCLDTMTHRGPDGWGLWSDDGVTLGHRRLSILDLSENDDARKFAIKNMPTPKPKCSNNRFNGNK